MKWFKGWRVWLGICATVTIPLLARDLYQIATNPPVLRAPLFAAQPVLANAHDEAFLPGNIVAKLTEVRTSVAGGYAGWSPRSTTLPKTAPTANTWFEGEKSFRGEIPAGKRAYHFATAIRGLSGNTLHVAIAGKPGIAPSNGGTNFNWSAYQTGYASGWLLYPLEDTGADVYVGVALASDRTILAQFPVPGKFGLSHGEESKWLGSTDGSSQPVEIMLPVSRRPRIASQYFMEIYRLDAMGTASRYTSPEIVTVASTTEQLSVHLPGRFRASDETCALRVTLTPFRWAKFADVPLSVGGANTAKLTPYPITPPVEQIRRNITGSSNITAFYEVVYDKPENLSHPQLARFVPNAVVISHTRQRQYPNAPLPEAGESYFYAYLPIEWLQSRNQLTLMVTTSQGKRVKAVPQQSTVNLDNQSCGIEWKLVGVSPDNIDAVSFGLAH